TQHYNNAICVEGLWQLANGASAQPDQYPVIGTSCDGSWLATSLGAQNKFFNFGDVKPADQGEDTISLHLSNNPAWACLDLHTTSNAENGVLSPEIQAGDNGVDNTTSGELAQNVSLVAWTDTDGDNIWDSGEAALTPSPILLSSALAGTTSLALADASIGAGPLGNTTDSHVGLAWCAGSFTGGAGNLACDGSTMNN